MKPLATTAICILALSFATFWVQWDVLEKHAYPLYIRVNILYFAATDSGFARDPLFWLVLAVQEFIVFGGASFVGASMGGSIRGIVSVAAGALVLHVLTLYVPRIGEATWEYGFACAVETILAIAATVSCAYLGSRVRLQTKNAR